MVARRPWAACLAVCGRPWPKRATDRRSTTRTMLNTVHGVAVLMSRVFHGNCWKH
jgi:hypothetical protein